MSALPSSLIAASALVIFALGATHVALTFWSTKLHPRDPEIEAGLREAFPVLTRETTMWKAWVGFNASHGFGAVFFSLVYGYLSLFDRGLLLGSPFLLLVGLLLLSGYLFLGWRYWFSVPFRGIVLATGLYLLALVVLLVERAS